MNDKDDKSAKRASLLERAAAELESGKVASVSTSRPPPLVRKAKDDAPKVKAKPAPKAPAAPKVAAQTPVADAQPPAEASQIGGMPFGGQDEAPTKTSRRGHIDLAALRDLGYVVPDSPATATAEEFRIVKRQLLINAMAEGDRRIENGNLILVCSSQPNEGKTFCAANLALSIASERDVTVLLVDADFAKPEILSTLGLEGGQRPDRRGCRPFDRAQRLPDQDQYREFFGAARGPPAQSDDGVAGVGTYGRDDRRDRPPLFRSHRDFRFAAMSCVIRGVCPCPARRAGPVCRGSRNNA
ncbi:hypothetical protein KCG44_09990 [Pacificimonas sp. WHA3]|uniref:Uncharacterized protein n=1 Tax=Pacificimonas pallii TaxID=2827236 RepID=A0ABS6SGS0_9SPHN|nr:hypothetical protein [Pacificimonas pallii]MBV7257111.1 hypothetical protein [Pacificimonas pallii]